MTTDRDAAENVLSALDDPMRRRILDVLANHSGETATILATALPISRQAVVKHLAVLDRAGLVAGHRAGREVRYVLCPQPLQTTARWMAHLAADWDRRPENAAPTAEPDGAGGSPVDV